MAWDTQGNAYYSRQMFNRGKGTSPNRDLTSGVWFFRSTGNGGASWNFPARPVVVSPDTAGTGAAAGLFFGDYTGLDVSNQAQPLWMDTRRPDLFLCVGTGVPGTPPANCQGTEPGGPQAGLTANDQDVFTAGGPIPH
jgi:hypothetical protein